MKWKKVDSVWQTEIPHVKLSNYVKYEIFRIWNGQVASMTISLESNIYLFLDSLHSEWKQHFENKMRNDNSNNGIRDEIWIRLKVTHRLIQCYSNNRERKRWFCNQKWTWQFEDSVWVVSSVKVFHKQSKQSKGLNELVN